MTEKSVVPAKRGTCVSGSKGCEGLHEEGLMCMLWRPVDSAALPSPQHTPGPWKVLLTREGKVCDGIVAGSAWNAEDEYWEDYIVQTDSGAYGPKLPDAYLIAAAPELLEALESFVNTWPTTTAYYEELSKPLSEGEQAAYDALRKGEAAIRAAKGETS